MLSFMWHSTYAVACVTNHRKKIEGSKLLDFFFLVQNKMSNILPYSNQIPFVIYQFASASSSQNCQFTTQFMLQPFGMSKKIGDLVLTK